MTRILVISIIALLHIVTTANAEIYLWPLHGLRRLSSSFSEFRDGRYHAGIDLRTFGRTGLPCLAVGDGEIRRIKIAPLGYGKALYLHLDDGNIAVYAHLSGFDRGLDSLTYYWRLERKTSWCDISLPPGTFRFSVGETLCYTGSTGTTAPHLHFEMRDERQRPFNPLETLYSVPDDHPPVISGLEIVPLSPESLANGSPRPLISLFRARGNRFFVLDDTLQLEGMFGFGASIWDEQGYGSYKMAPLSVELLIDGTSFYRLVNSRFDYGQNDVVLLEYDIFGTRADGRYQLLFKKEGNTRTDRDGTGVIHAQRNLQNVHVLEHGLHRGEIIACDAAGNESRANFHFVLHRYPVVSMARKLSAAADVVVGSFDPDGGTVEMELFESLNGGSSWQRIVLEPFGRFHRGETSPVDETVYRYIVRDDEGATVERFFASPLVRQDDDKVFCECIPELAFDGIALKIVTDRILASAPRVVRLAGGSFDTSAVQQMGPKEYFALFHRHHVVDGLNVFYVSGSDHRGYPLRSAYVLNIFKLDPGTNVTFNASDSLQCELHAVSIRARSICIIREIASPGETPSDLGAVSPPFAIEMPADLLIELRIVCDPGRNVGLFHWKDDRGWKCVGVPEREGGYIRVTKTGTYAFFRDGLPPHLRAVAIERIPEGSGFFKPYAYYLPVIEKGSGIDPYSAEAYLNGRMVVCEWDDFRERLYISVPRATAGGPTSLRVEISDRAGNRSVGEYGFVIE